MVQRAVDLPGRGTGRLGFPRRMEASPAEPPGPTDSIGIYERITVTYFCKCGARPSVPVGVTVAATRAHDLHRDLYTDLPGYGLPDPLG